MKYEVEANCVFEEDGNGTPRHDVDVTVKIDGHDYYVREHYRYRSGDGRYIRFYKIDGKEVDGKEIDPEIICILEDEKAESINDANEEA